MVEDHSAVEAAAFGRRVAHFDSQDVIIAVFVVGVGFFARGGRGRGRGWLPVLRRAGASFGFGVDVWSRGGARRRATVWGQRGDGGSPGRRTRSCRSRLRRRSPATFEEVAVVVGVVGVCLLVFVIVVAKQVFEKVAVVGIGI